jgi:hypothetical protein
MSAFVKYNAFIDEISKGGHNLQTDVIKVALTNAAPDPASDTVFNATVVPPPASANGYPAGGNVMTTVSAATVAGIFKLIFGDSVFTAITGGIGPFRYAVLYNSSKADKLIGYYDYGSNVSLAPTDTFTVDTDPGTGVLTIA